MQETHSRELVSGYIPPISMKEARPTKPRRSSTMVFCKSIGPILSGMFWGNPISFRHHKTVDIEIPDERPKLSKKAGITYGEDRPKLAVNEFEVPDTELLTFNDLSSDIAESFKQSLYAGAATLKAMDTANDYVAAALNDGIDLGIEMDERPFDAFVHLARLQVLSTAVNHLTISERQKVMLLSYLTKSLAEKAIEAMTAADVSQKRSAALQDHFRALVRPTSSDPLDEVKSNPIAVRRSRG